MDTVGDEFRRPSVLNESPVLYDATIFSGFLSYQ